MTKPIAALVIGVPISHDMPHVLAVAGRIHTHRPAGG